MSHTLQLDKMSHSEKLRAMELLWEALSCHAEYESPSWHGAEIQATQQRLTTGQEAILDWSTAKTMLRQTPQ
jgi:hypothetical protein